MRTAIDANIISLIWSKEPSADAVLDQLEMAQRDGALIISPFAFAELHAHPNVPEDFVRTFLEATGVVIDYQLAENVWTEAGLRFARYAVRRRKATAEGPRRILADFLIGAHALVQSERLLTLDPKVYGQDFPELRLL